MPVAMPSGGRRDWDALVWNLGGLHHLHMWQVERKSEGRPINYTFDEYYRSTIQCARTLNAAFPSAARVMKLSNNVCEDKFLGEFAREVAQHREQREDPRYTMQMTELGSVSLRVAEREAARMHGHFVKDADTDGLCACSGPSDGRHFPTAVPGFVVRLHNKLLDVMNGGHLQGGAMVGSTRGLWQAAAHSVVGPL